jgi:hypothetical protein
VPALLALLLRRAARGDRFAAVEPWSCRRAGLALLFVAPYVALSSGSRRSCSAGSRRR